MLQLFCHASDIVALVAVGRERDLFAEQAKIAQPGGEAENVHLPAGVIDVILTRHVPAGKGEQAGQRCAIRGTPAMADVQGAGGVGRNKLDLDLLRAPLGGAAKVSALVEGRAYDFGFLTGGQAEVDETGAGNFSAADPRRSR